MIEPKVEDGVDLRLAERIAPAAQARFVANLQAEALHLRLRELEGEQFDFCFLAIVGTADEANEFIQIGERDQITFQDFSAFFGLSQFELCPSNHHLSPMFDITMDEFLQVERFRPTAIDREHVHGERRFELRVLVKIVDDHLGDRLPFQLDDDPGVFVRLVPHRRDVRDDLFVDQLRNALFQSRPVDVVRNFRDDQLLAAALQLFNAGLAANLDAPPTGLKILFDSLHAADHAAGRKIRTFNKLHQLQDRNVRVVDLGADAVNDFTEVVRWNVRRHADGDAGAPVDEQIGKRRWEDGRLGARLVVVRDKIHRFFVHVLHERGAQMRHAGLGITHRGRRVVFDGAEVAFAVHEPLAHGPPLRHVYQRGINHRFPMRMVVAAGVTADFRALTMLPVGKERQIVHRVKDAALGGFQTVAHVGQRARDDHRHRIVEERILDLLRNIDLGDFFIGGKQRRVAHRQVVRVFWLGHRVHAG